MQFSSTIFAALVASAALVGATPLISRQAANSTTSAGGNSTTSAGNTTVSTNSTSPYSNITGAPGPYGLNNTQCTNLTLTTAINSTTQQVFLNVDDNYSNATYVTQQILDFTTDQANWTAQHLGPTNGSLNATYSIAAQYCTPISNALQNSSLLVGVHGIGFDKSYWDFGYSQNYSLVRHAASHGYSTFIFDRLGTGESDHPSTGGFSVVQAPTELAILQNILTQLRNSTIAGNTTHDRISLIGHSYGSALSQAISSKYPELIDNLILTGFSTNSSYVGNFAQAATFTPANLIQGAGVNANWTNLTSIYLGTASNVSDVQLFLDPPNYEQGAAELARSTGQPVTFGQLFTQAALAATAQNFTGPVFVVDGTRDLPFCGRQCDAPSGNYSNFAAAVQQLYPATKNFTSSLISLTGHGISEHPTSAMAYEQVIQQIIGNGF